MPAWAKLGELTRKRYLTPFLPASVGNLVPTLQREDGSYIAYDASGSLYGFDNLYALGLDGSVQWQQQIPGPPNGSGTNSVTPLYATADGGVIATSTFECSANLAPPLPVGWTWNTCAPWYPSSGGTLSTLNQNGTVTSQTADTGAVLSWTGQWYDPPATGSAVSNVTGAILFDYASSLAATNGGGPGLNGVFIPSIQKMYRAEIAALATGYVGSLQWPEPPLKCNKFVHDILNQAADAIGQSQNFPAPMEPPRSRFLLTRVDPLLAADWAAPYIDGCWQPLAQGPDGAQPGDVLATGWPAGGNDATGHVGIIVAPQQGIVPNLELVSAASDPPYFWTPVMKQGFIAGTITLTDYGFRLPGYDGNPNDKQGLKTDSHVKRFRCF